MENDETVLETLLKKELFAAYMLLLASVPLALMKLYDGGITSLDQMAFWDATKGAEEFIDSIVEHDDGPGKLTESIQTRMDQLDPRG